ncbi:nitrile hydratase subunit alpha [Paenibacillus alginolyticus]|uniref:nitrile hydratase n=1 Tax=Paenibacillus alginolyticus TaxID=59839 RepID=A0ABT4G8Z0_9BACL|nr:nitrile hydratase subunit alpha [Paenibacillus alginolyticus]MCY9666815.1 nitrile hydratase subunit alpha [Paenibacillus alginolyticus]MCY9692657.1 nitrile hydratase subunit alpha [Paenibacillus alginolyticus]MEC0148754.1 nitrile hydratase subunit alpha [Paenibacillus alginolyticus]
MKNIEEHHHHTHDHDHHDHHHAHKLSESFEELRTMAIESLLIEKGLISVEEVDELIHHYVSDIGPMNGAKVVARAWVDSEFKQRLLQNGKKAISELGLENMHNELIVLENTPEIHNVVVCTLCSCYPWALLGLPPAWYKSTAYRSRVVIDPRSVIREFGLELDESVEIRVWDSNAEIRYLILPERPEGTDHMNEEELAGIVSRDAMIGVSKVKIAN